MTSEARPRILRAADQPPKITPRVGPPAPFGASRGGWRVSYPVALREPVQATLRADLHVDEQRGTRCQLSASDGTQVGGGWRDHPWPNTVAFSPDGSLLASAGHDGPVVLRDLASGQQFGPPLTTSPARERAWAGFDAAGRLVVASKDGGLWRWDVSLPHLLLTACAIAGRDLTADEWSARNTSRPQVAACS